jgi:hypothetical protein
MPDEPLSVDIAAFRADLPSLAGDAGKWAVYFEGKRIGVFETYHEALTKGYATAGEKPFLAEQISAIPAIQHFSRTLDFECLTSA